MAAIGLAIAATLSSTPAGAQSSPSSSRPGPYVIDIRAPMSGLPSTSAFHPVLPADTLVPKRGFGVAVGGHVYPASLGVARIGVGVEVLRVRGTASTPAPTTTPATTSTSVLSARDQIDVVTTMTMAGRVGTTGSGTVVAPLTGPATVVRDAGRAAAINYGGGARWFIRGRVAVGFDLRFHRFAALGTRPSTKFVVASVGLSVR